MSTETVPKGYKRTEVGVIPEEWILQQIGMLGAGVMPAIKAGPFGSALTKDQYVPAGYKVYGQEQVIRGDYLYGDYFIDAKKYHKLESCSVRPGDILLSLVGTVGKLLEIPENAPPGVINPRLLRFSLDKRRILSGYFRYLFESSIVQSRLGAQAQGGTMGVLNAGVFRGFEIALPSIAEQQAIAAALSDADALIESLERLLAKKRQIKQGAMQELLTGMRRLPGFSGKWEQVRVEDVSDVKTGPFGSTLHESDYVQTGTPIITVEHLGELGVTYQNLPLVSDADCKRLQAYSLEVGDIVFSRVGSVDRNAIIRENENGWLFSGRLLRVRPDRNKVFPQFLSYLFHGEKFRNAVLAVAVGQTMASLNTKILNGLTLHIPTLPEQSAIASVLSDMDAELEVLEGKLEKARQVKQGMMQQLLTGKVRLV